MALLSIVILGFYVRRKGAINAFEERVTVTIQADGVVEGLGGCSPECRFSGDLFERRLDDFSELAPVYEANPSGSVPDPLRRWEFEQEREMVAVQLVFEHCEGCRVVMDRRAGECEVEYRGSSAV